MDKDTLEELADVLEVIQALSRVHGAEPLDLERIRTDKFNERGGFQDRVYLIDVE